MAMCTLSTQFNHLMSNKIIVIIIAVCLHMYNHMSKRIIKNCNIQRKSSTQATMVPLALQIPRATWRTDMNTSVTCTCKKVIIQLQNIANFQ